MTGQSLKLGKFMTDQVVNMFGHVQWLSIILTPVIQSQLLILLITFILLGGWGLNLYFLGSKADHLLIYIRLNKI